MKVIANTLLRVGLLPWARLGGGRVQLVLPEWCYDLCALLFFPANWLIALLASRFPRPYTAADWTLDPALAPGRLGAPAPGLRESLRRRDNAYFDETALWALFDSLPGPSTNAMLGNWQGKVVRSGSWLDPAVILEGPLRALGLEWGKRYFTPHRGDPFLLVLWDRVLLPMPIWGNVSVPELNYRGKIGAVMVYDHQPWKDHFRVLDDGAASGRRMLLGNWMSREKNGGWFTLEELPEANRAVQDLLVRAPQSP